MDPKDDTNYWERKAGPRAEGTAACFCNAYRRPSFFISRTIVTPQLLASARMDEMMLFLVVIMGSPTHIKSSHLRSKMSEVLHAWLPQVWIIGMDHG